jgi:general secretion pathway protein J
LKYLSRLGAGTQHGFTLIEVLVALVLVSLMSLLAWRGINGMHQAVQQTAEYEQGAQRLSTTLAQWTVDLDALTETGVVKAMDYDGQLLRLTRRSSDAAGVVVVGWVIRSGRLLRYASSTVTDKTALQAAYLAAARWGRTPLPEDAGRTVDLLAVNNWQIFYYRGDGWSNSLSSAGASNSVGNAGGGGGGGGGGAGGSVAGIANAPPSVDVLPDGVRLILDIAPGAGLTGLITRDWVQPTLGATR